MRNHTLRMVAMICTLGVAAHLPCSAEADRLRVTIETSALITSSAGPFSIALMLTDGSAIQDGRSSVMVEHLWFDQGYPLGAPVIFGGAQSNMDSGVTLTNSSPLSVYEQSFYPGRELTFDLSFTSGKKSGGLPSRLSVYLLDRSGKAIATLAPGGDFFVGLDLISDETRPQVFGSNPLVPPYQGGPIVIPTPNVDD